MAKKGKKKRIVRKKVDRDLKISACMMVKDEEDLLPGCLNSIKEFVDEIIIVDTGSTDRTVEIAESFGAKVFFHPWENNFSKHRNQSISYATGDWFVIIDADEELEPHGLTKKRLKEFIKRLPENIHAILFTVKDIKQDGTVSHTFKSLRLFKNNVGFHYKGIVHNNPEVKGDVISLDIDIKHYGYDLNKEQMDGKFKRTSSLLLKRIEENPEDIAAYYYLANLYGFRNGWDKTIEYGEKCVELLISNKDAMVPAYDALYRIIGKAYAGKHDSDSALSWFQRGLEILPDDPDLNFELSAAGASISDYRIIIEYGLKYLEFLDKFRKDPNLASGRILYSLDKKFEDSTQYNLMNAYLGLRRFEEAEERWRLIKDMMLATHFMQEEYLKNLSVVDSGDLLLERTVFFLNKKPDSISLVDPLILYCIKEETFEQTYRGLRNDLSDFCNFEALSIRIGRLLVQHERYQNAIEVLEPCYCSGIAENDLFCNLALAYDRSGSCNRAEQVYLNGIENRINNDEFLKNSLDFFKKIGNETAMESTVSILLEKYSALSDIEDSILLFLSEYFLKRNQTDRFFDAAFALFDRNGVNGAWYSKDKNEVADKYDLMSKRYEERADYAFALQCLNLASFLTLNPYYSVRMGDIHLKIKQPAKAVEYYQSAMNKNHLSPDMLENMSTAFNLIGNREGSELCSRLRLAILPASSFSNS